MMGTFVKDRSQCEGLLLVKYVAIWASKKKFKAINFNPVTKIEIHNHDDINKWMKKNREE